MQDEPNLAAAWQRLIGYDIAVMGKRLAARAARILLYIAIGGAWLWCLLALLYFPLAARWAGLVLAVSFAAATLVAARRAADRRRLLRWYWAASGLVLLAWLAVPPTHSRSWSRLQAVPPQVEIDQREGRVLVRNMRQTVYEADGSYQVRHYEDEFQLSGLQSVWYGVQHFASFRGIAHTFISFGFDDGRYLAISVESRRGEGQPFSPLAGLFKQYGLIYIIGDEREVIGHRTLQRQDPIYLYPIKASRQQMRDMLLSMLRRASQLGEQPEFYNTLTNNCTTNIVDSFNQIAPIEIFSYSPRIVFPGFSGDMAYEQGLIDTAESFEQLQERACINDKARDAAEAEDFSRQIRAGLFAQ